MLYIFKSWRGMICPEFWLSVRKEFGLTTWQIWCLSFLFSLSLSCILNCYSIFWKVLILFIFKSLKFSFFDLAPSLITLEVDSIFFSKNWSNAWFVKHTRNKGPVLSLFYPSLLIFFIIKSTIFSPTNVFPVPGGPWIREMVLLNAWLKALA